jgi:DNA-binding transcriptional regulator YhcF (GntR family)
LYDAIDRASDRGRLTPCRLSGEFDAEDLDAAAAVELVDRCVTECPVLRECTDLAVLLPMESKRGSVIAATYHPPVKTTRWQPVYDELRDRIEASEYSLGDRLPSITELAREMDVHGNVIRAALDHLERDGMAVRGGTDRRMVVAYGTIIGPHQHDLEQPADDDMTRSTTAADPIGQVA